MARLTVKARGPRCGDVPGRPARHLPGSAAFLASGAFLASATSPPPTDPNRCLSSETIAPVPGSPIAPKRLGSPATDFGAGMTSGPATFLAAAWLLAMPRSAMLTVAQASTATAPTIRARAWQPIEF